MNRSWYGGKEVANFVGISYDVFCNRRSREVRHRRDGLPRPYSMRPLRFDKAAIDAWRNRHHPVVAAMAPPANDAAPQPAPEGAAWQPFLAQVYAER